MKKIVVLCGVAVTAATFGIPAMASGNTNNATADALYMPSVSIAPYFGVKDDISGSELVINNPSINDDLAILRMRQQQNAAKKSKSIKPDRPHLVFSGYVEGQASYVDPYIDSYTSDIDFTGAELDAMYETNADLTGYMSFSYDNGTTSNGTYRVNNANVELNQGFMTYGDLDRSPVYFTLGQIYVPFGTYSSTNYTDPMTKTLGRIKTRALEVGYANDKGKHSPYGAAYVFQGATNINDEGDRLNEYGVNYGMKFGDATWSADFGLGYVSNIAESSGMQGDGSTGGDFSGFAESSTYEAMDDRVPGADVHASFSMNKVSFITEYVTATTDFADDEVTFNGEGAKPRAVDAEVAYSFSSMGNPSSVAFGYDKSWESLAFGLAEQRYFVSYNVNLWKHTLLNFEVARDSGYDEGTTATGPSSATVDTDSLGQKYTSVLLTFDAFF